MTTIRVFDPALCCSTGVCGVDIDQALVTFAADIDWLKSKGVTVERINLAQQPQVFAEHPTVRDLLQAQGERALPVLLVDGELKASGRYPSRDELSLWAGLAPATLLFTEKVAELVAIGAAIASNCEPCFRFHYGKARKLGVADDDVRRAVDLAQQVKEAPARAVLDLAHRSLNGKDASNDVGVVSNDEPQKQGSCCAPTPSPVGESAPKCC